jgi:hypothetical protein
MWGSSIKNGELRIKDEGRKGSLLGEADSG